METNKFITQLVIDSWHHQLKIADKLFKELSEVQLFNEIAVGKNRGVYLLGHLTAVHDRMLPLLGLGEQLYPELNSIYLQTPDKAVADTPTVTELLNYWSKVNETLNSHLANLSADAWLQKHTSVTEEDFVKEPTRNKLNVLISRTNHLANHIGQLLLLK